MINEIIIFITFQFLLSFFFVKISNKLNLIDYPNERKLHTKEVPYTGGMVISISLIFSTLIFDNPENNLILILSTGFTVSLLGLIDDKLNLSARNKLVLQFIPIFYLISIQNMYLSDLGDYNYFKLNLGLFGIPFTLLSVLFLINSFNYFDGLNGTLGTSTNSVLLILYFLIHDQDLQYFLLIIFISLNIFLLFNFSLFKLPTLFLGDSGSLFLGFLISFTMIYLANENLIHPILIAWSVTIYVYEFLSINFIRLINKKGLLKAGHDHFHHILFRRTNSIFLTNFFISLINIILFTIGYLGYLFIGPILSLILFILLFILFFTIRNKYSFIK